MNLVANPEFSGAGEVADGWSYVSPRPDLVLGHGVKRNAAGDAVLVLEATDDRLAFGCWRGTLAIEPQKWYEASVKVRLIDIEDPTLSVFAQAARHFLAPEGPWAEETVLRQLVRSDRDHEFQGNHFEVYLRAATRGRIEISDPSFIEIPDPDFRTARVATVRFDHEINNLTVEQQRDRLAEQLDLAGGVEPDIVITTEFTPVIGVPESEYKSFWDVAEPVPDGPVCRIASAAAKKHNMHVIVGNIERRGAHMFNTAVLFGRDGRFLGQYDKTHLTIGELEWGVSCGDKYPLFDLDFGRIGIHICYDEWFPEVARYYAHQGAEILFLCVAGGKPITWRTRALDNGVHFVASSTLPPSIIIESSGDIVAENHRGGFAWADLNLDYRQTNAYRDPMLAYGMPCIAPQMRNVLDHQLLDDLSGSIRDINRPSGPK
jgi:predicted amidohydrolase